MICVRGCLRKEGALCKGHLSHPGVACQVIVAAVRGILYDTPKSVEHSLVVADMVGKNLVVSTRIG